MTNAQTILPVRGVVPVGEMAGESEQETEQLYAMHREAIDYLTMRPWCHGIHEHFYGHGIGGVVAVFFFRVDPVPMAPDGGVWVIVGDLPPACLPLQGIATAAEALRAYLKEMSRWVALARHGRTSDDLLPVNVPSTGVWADVLAKRLKLLKDTALPLFPQHTTRRFRDLP